MRGVILLLLSGSCTWTVRLECGGCPDDLLCTNSGTCPKSCNSDDQCVDGTSCDDGACVPGCTFDEDLDGVCDRNDVCSGGPDSEDVDSDSVPDFCDDCVGGDAGEDADGDGVCDADDTCPGSDDRLDDDEDGYANECDSCDGPGRRDDDGDEVCDEADECPAVDDRLDYDENGAADCAQRDGVMWAFRSIPGWNGTVSHSQEEATGLTSSGSLRVASTSGSLRAQGPCVTVVPDAEYVLGAYLLTAGGSAHLGLELYSDSQCQQIVEPGSFPAFNRPNWTQFVGLFTAEPFSQAATIRGVRVTVDNLITSPANTVWLDNVAVLRQP